MTDFPKFRADIQSLRGIAVLQVLLYHTQLTFTEAGYLGVDIFFVISGFLITGIIHDSLAKGEFRLGAFYARRFRRILPASTVVIVASIIAARWLAVQPVEDDTIIYGMAALTFLSNVALWLKLNYFL